MKKFVQKHILFIALSQALTAMLMSLFFSEVLHFTPCVLCWYQRICMYPLVAILSVGILREDKKIHQYVLPLSVGGFLISIYHNLLYYHILPESIAPCTAGVSCTTRLIVWFGFISIPLLALIAFTVISLCMIIHMRSNKE